MMDALLGRSIEDLRRVLDGVAVLGPPLERLGQTLLRSWQEGGKALLAGNGGSAADAMHLAEELLVRFARNRRALAALALCDPAALTCAGNDLGFDRVFSRQIEALGRPGDVLIVFSTSGNSGNILRALEAAKSRGLITASFLGKDGGRARGMSDIELLVDCADTARVQEAHQLLYHVLCEWVEAKLEPEEAGAD